MSQFLNSLLDIKDQEKIIDHAITLQRNGQAKEAIAIYEKLLEKTPNHAVLLFWCGSAYQQINNPYKSIDLLLRSLTIDDTQVKAHHNLGLAFRSISHLDQAINYFSKAIALDPKYLSAYLNRARAYHTLEAFSLALDDLTSAININGTFELYCERASLLYQLNCKHEAITDYDQAIRLQPDIAEVYCNKGVAQFDIGKFEQALRSYQKALMLNPQLIEAHLNEGNCLKELGRHSDAIKSYSKALSIEPRNLDALSSRGVAYQELGLFEQAMQDYSHAINQNPNHVNSQWNRAICLLLQGNYAEGWAAYEWGWLSGGRGEKRNLQSRLWLGKENLQGCTILIYGEQGFGDIIQFVRYVPHLQKLGAKVLLEIPATLAELCSSVAPDIRIIEKDDPLPYYEFHCPLMSLPLALQTQIKTIPNQTPYLFSNPIKRTNLKKRLSATNELKVGIAWSGQSKHQNNSKRSIALKQLEPLINISVQWHSLQIEYSEYDRNALIKFPQINQHQDILKDFSDTAALIDQLDLVISVDTSVAHLAGALGKSVWIMLPSAPDFRWLTKQSISPWYPTARLFRQEFSQDWSSVIKTVSDKLKIQV